uniref:Uncharacterized protein n=1 Tax=Colletotrichum fructicola (strain Nara gc5) TaxID=1213859 RepID=L2FF13_COLFN
MAYLLESLDRVTILLVSTWNEILSNEDHQNWFQSQTWDEIKKICALIRSFHQRSTEGNSGMPNSDDLSGGIKEAGGSQQSQDAKRVIINCPESSGLGKTALSDMVALLRQKLQSAGNLKANATDAGTDRGVKSPKLAYSSPSQPISTPAIATEEDYLSSLMQAFWDWRKIVNAGRDQPDYRWLRRELKVYQPREPYSLCWHPDYIQDAAVEPIFEGLAKLTPDHIWRVKKRDISSGTFLGYLMSQTLSAKSTVFNDMLRWESRSDRTRKGKVQEYLGPTIAANPLYEDQRVYSLLNWLEMSLNLDQSNPMRVTNDMASGKPWAVSFKELLSQLGLSGSQSERKEEEITRENSEYMRREDGLSRFAEPIPVQGDRSWEKGNERDAWKMLLELVDETKRHLLPLEDLFTAQSSVKLGSNPTEEGQWGDVCIV